MSMITEQIEELRNLADSMERAGQGISAKYVKDAAETIRKLSVKLRTKNIKQSREYYNGWISVEEQLPANRQCVLFQTRSGKIYQGIYFSDIIAELGECQWYSYKYEDFAHNSVVIVWMPLPERYEDKEEKND